MSHHHSIHIPIFEGEEDPKRHWFVGERMWDVADVTDEDKQIAQFAGTQIEEHIMRQGMQIKITHIQGVHATQIVRTGDVAQQH
jgi:hypothetical protein